MTAMDKDTILTDAAGADYSHASLKSAAWLNVSSADKMRAAAGLIRKRGWNPWPYGLATAGPYSSAGAMMAVSVDQKELDVLRTAFLAAAWTPDDGADARAIHPGLVGFKGTSAVAYWDEVPGRTAEEALAVFDRAVVILDNIRTLRRGQ